MNITHNVPSLSRAIELQNILSCNYQCKLSTLFMIAPKWEQRLTSASRG